MDLAEWCHVRVFKFILKNTLMAPLRGVYKKNTELGKQKSINKSKSPKIPSIGIREQPT